MYRGVDGHIHELWWSDDANWNYADLSGQSGAPLAAGNPAGYAWEGDQTQHVMYRGVDGHIHELWWSQDSGWQHTDLSAGTGAPPAAGESGRLCLGARSHRARPLPGHGRAHPRAVVHAEPGWQHADLSLATGAPAAGGDPAAYAWEGGGTQHVVYRGVDDQVHELWFRSRNYVP